MMSLCHDWGWQPPQSASRIHIGHVQKVWAHWYAVHRHMVAALHSDTHPTCPRFWGSGSHLESTWWHYVIVEADSHLKLFPASILDIQSVLAHWYTVHWRMVAALHRYPYHLAQIVGYWVTRRAKMMSLHHGWGWQLPQPTSHIHIDIYKVFEHIDMLSIGIQ
jgi:hypothetical protein